MPVANALAERGARSIKRINTRLRSSHKQDMIMTLMNASINGPNTGDSQQVTKKSVKRWRSKIDRRKLSKQRPNNRKN